MAYDIFTGLPLNQSIAGAAWDSGAVSWANGTGEFLVGDGNNAVKSSVVGSTALGNYTALSVHIGQRIFFKQVAGRSDFALALLNLYVDGDGTAPNYNNLVPSVGVRAQIGAYNLLFIRDMATGTEAQANCTLVDGSEYCLELKQTGTANQYRATVYNASAGVVGTQLGTATQVLTVATPIANTNKRVFLNTLQGQYITINRVESVDGAATPVGFGGPVPTRNGTVGSAASFANASFFSGTATPFVYTLQAGTLPAGLTLNSSTGIISGTPTTAGTASGIVVRATDTASATADTNAYSIVIAAANAAPTFTGTIANITGSAGAAITTVNVSSAFSDTDTLTYSASPAGTAWPSGLVINASTGVISGTVAQSTTTGLKVRATDTASQTVDSNAFSVTIGAAPAAAGTFVTDACTSSGTLRVSQTVNYTWFAGGVIGTSTGTATHGSGTLSAAAKLTVASLPAGAGYMLMRFADGGIAYQAGTVA